MGNGRQRARTSQEFFSVCIHARHIVMFLRNRGCPPFIHRVSSDLQHLQGVVARRCVHALRNKKRSDIPPCAHIIAYTHEQHETHTQFANHCTLQTRTRISPRGAAAFIEEKRFEESERVDIVRVHMHMRQK
jgi:hypothetical protein